MLKKKISKKEEVKREYFFFAVSNLLIDALGGVGGTAGLGGAALQGLPIFEGCRKFDAFVSDIVY